MSMDENISALAVAIGTNLKGKQSTLISGTNIKTIDGMDLLGSGNLVVASGKVDKVDGKGLSTNDFTDSLKTLLETKKVKNVDTDIANNRLIIRYTDESTVYLNFADIAANIQANGAVFDINTKVLTLKDANNNVTATIDLSVFALKKETMMNSNAIDFIEVPAQTNKLLVTPVTFNRLSLGNGSLIKFI